MFLLRDLDSPAVRCPRPGAGRGSGPRGRFSNGEGGGMAVPAMAEVMPLTEPAAGMPRLPGARSAEGPQSCGRVVAGP